MRAFFCTSVRDAVFFLCSLISICLCTTRLWAADTLIPLSNNFLDEIPLQPGSVLIGCPEDFPPYSYRDENGQPAGLYPDYIAALNRRLNNVLRPVLVSHGEDHAHIGSSAHWNEDAQIGLSDYMPTDNALLSDSLFRSSTVLLGPPNSGKHSLEQDIRVVVLAHTPVPPNISQRPGTTLLTRPNMAEAIAVVRKGEAEFILGDELSVRFPSYALPPELPQQTIISSHYHSIIAKPDLAALLSMLDDSLRRIPPSEREAIASHWRGKFEPIVLSDAEKIALHDLRKVRVAVFPWLPYSTINSNNDFTGMLADYLDILKKILNVTFVPVSFSGWGPAQLALENGRVDMAVLPRLSWLHEKFIVSRPWFTVPAAIVAAEGSEASGMANLSGKVVAVTAGSALEEWIQKTYPDIIALPVINSRTAISALAQGNAYAVLGPLDTVAQLLHDFPDKNLVVTGLAPFSVRGVFALRPGLVLPAQALDKALASISPAEARHIHQQWAHTRHVPAMDWVLFRQWLAGILFIMMLITGIFFYFNNKLRKEVREHRKAKNLLSTMFSRIPAAMILFDVRLHCITTNDAVQDIFGLNKDFLPGKGLVQAATRAGLPRGTLTALRRIEQSAEQALQDRSRVILHHHDIVDGKDRWFETSLLPLPDHQGRPDRLLMVSSDVTAAKMLEQELRSSLDFSKSLIDSLPLPVVVYDTDGRYMLLNKAYCEAFEVTEQQLLGKTSLENNALDELCRVFIHGGLSMLNLGETVRREGTYTLSDNRQRTALVYLSPISDAHARMTVGAAVDITDRKIMEEDLRAALNEASELSATKSAFLARMSHELRTPMNGILGLSEVLLREADTERERQYLEKIHTAGRSLVRVITDILDFSKLDGGINQLVDAPFDLYTVLTSVTEALEPSVLTKSLTFKAHISVGTPCLLRGDAARLEQALLCLAGNAIKFTDVGGVEIRVRETDHNNDESLLRFEIIDTGIGMSPETVAQVFQPFSLADESMSRVHGGLGLGLNIAQKLVHAMHGEIQVSSEPGKGTHLSFTALFVLARRDDVGSNDDQENTFETESTATLPALEAAPTAAPVAAAAPDKPDTPVTANTLVAAAMPDKPDTPDAATTATMPDTATMPVTADADDAADMPDAADMLDPLLAGKYVLLVEDNFINQAVAQEQLMVLGLEVETADDGQEGLEKAKATAYDCILMDIQMPRMDGLTATRLIKEDPTLVHIPVIAVTAHAADEDKRKSFEVGMEDHLTKPLQMDVLQNTLRRVLAPGFTATVPNFAKAAGAAHARRTATDTATGTATAATRTSDAPDKGDA